MIKQDLESYVRRAIDISFADVPIAVNVHDTIMTTVLINNKKS